MRIVGLDIGTVRIGVAASDILKMIASPHSVIKRTTEEADLEKVAETIGNLEAEKVVIGLPLKMDGSEGQSVQMARDFGDKLSKIIGVPIVYQDERLSTVSAERVLIKSGMRREKRKDKIDSVAATFILQTYLDKF